MSPRDLSSIAADLAADLDGAFPSYVRATADGIYSGALRMLGDHTDAEDIMQETFARAYKALQGYSPRRIAALRVRGWTWTIAANLCRNRLRSRARKPTTPLPESEPRASGSGTDEEALGGIGPDLKASLLALPFAQRAAVVLRHVADLTYEDVAAALGRPVGTVKADVHRGLARLRSLYPKEESR